MLHSLLSSATIVSAITKRMSDLFVWDSGLAIVRTGSFPTGLPLLLTQSALLINIGYEVPRCPERQHVIVAGCPEKKSDFWSINKGALIAFFMIVSSFMFAAISRSKAHLLIMLKWRKQRWLRSISNIFDLRK